MYIVIQCYKKYCNTTYNVTILLCIVTQYYSKEMIQESRKIWISQRVLHFYIFSGCTESSTSKQERRHLAITDFGAALHGRVVAKVSGGGANP